MSISMHMKSFLLQIGKLKLRVMEREVKGSQNMEHLLDAKCVQ